MNIRGGSTFKSLGEVTKRLSWGMGVGDRYGGRIREVGGGEGET